MRFLTRSTRRKVGQVYYSVRRLHLHVIRQFRHRNQLKSHCEGKYGILLNVGCGPLVPEGWVNIDYEPSAGKSYYFDALDDIPIVDDTVQHIHCEHFLEHLDFADAVRFLAECHRILTPSGSMRIIVPDAERYMKAYSDNDEEFFTKLINLGGHAEPLIPKNRVCNHSFRMWGDHRFAWDFETLNKVAQDLNFSQIERSTINDMKAEYRIDGQDWWRPFESLYANLKK